MHAKLSAPYPTWMAVFLLGKSLFWWKTKPGIWYGHPEPWTCSLVRSCAQLRVGAKAMPSHAGHKQPHLVVGS